MLTVGEILRNEREKQNITLAQVEKRIKVREKYLRDLENNNWDNFSSKIYVSGIIRNYTKFLGLDSTQILAFFRRDYEKKEEVKFKKRVSSHYLTSQTRRFTLIGIILVFLFFVGYFGFQLKQYFSPPKIQIIKPKETTFKNEDRIRIIGKTQKESAVTIFGERVFPDKEGVFEYDMPLKKGNNQLIIEVIGANGRKQVFKKVFIRL